MYEFKFPDIGEGLHEGKILELKLQPGDAVEEGDILAVVETDKVVAEIPSPKTGVLRRFGSVAGRIIKVGDPFAYIAVDGAEEGTDQGDSDDRLPEDRSRPPKGATVVGQLDAGDDLLPPRDEPAAPGASEDGAPHRAGDPGPECIVASGLALATPAARRLARDPNVDLGSVLRGTGDCGRIQKSDIYQAALPAAAPPALGNDGFGFPLIDDPVTRPVVHDLGEVDELVKLRAQVNRNRAAPISYQPFIMKALASALSDVPVLNATYDPVSQDVTVYREVNVGFAVSTEAGVLLPVIRNVDTGAILALDRQMKQLVAAARKRSLAADDLRGGTFALTNFGPFGGLWAAPMIFPPQVAILGIGRIHQAPRVVDGGAIEARAVLPVSLAFDHRVVDGVPAATFLSRFLQLLCSPQELRCGAR